MDKYLLIKNELVVEKRDRQQAAADEKAICAEINEGGPILPDDVLSSTSSPKSK